MQLTSEELQKMTDITEACELLEAVAIDRQGESPVESMSLIFVRDDDNFIDIELPLSIRDKLISTLRPLLDEIRRKFLARLNGS